MRTITLSYFSRKRNCPQSGGARAGHVVYTYVMTPEQEALLKETYELARDNNKMLHAAKRNAFIAGTFRVVMYAAFIVLPMYFFYTTIVPMLNDTAAKVNSVSAKVQGAQTQVQSMGDTLQQYKNLLNGSYMSQ